MGQVSKRLSFLADGIGLMLFIGVLSAAPVEAPAAPASRPRVAALAIQEPIRVDGVLDEIAWQQAEVAGDFVQREPSPGQPASERTEIRVAYTQSMLYIAIRAFATNPDDIVGEEMQRDGQLFRDDSVVVLLDTFNDDRNAYFFETNPNGARTDGLLTDEGRDFNVQWNAVWDAAAQRNSDGWVAEMAIPFTTLRFDPRVDTWGFQVRRLIRHRSEEVFWAPLPLEANLFRISLAGDLTGIRGPEPGLNLRLKPPGTPLLKPFFSRRLGISPTGTVVPIDWVARLTGRVGEWSLGLLDVQTDATPLFRGVEVPQTNWGVLRLKRNIGQRSSLGVIATRRDGEAGGQANEVFGLDATLRPTQRLSLDGFYTQSRNSTQDPRPRAGDDWSAGARAIWQGPVWNWGFDAFQIGESYNPEVGFLLRQGVRRYFPRFGYQPRPALRSVRNLNFGGAVDLYTDLDDRVQSRVISSDLFGVVFLSEDFVGLFGNSTLERLPGPFEIVPGVIIPQGEHEWEDAGVRFETNSSRPLSASGFLMGGGFFDGDRVSSQLNVGVRANRHLRSDTSWSATTSICSGDRSPATSFASASVSPGRQTFRSTPTCSTPIYWTNFP